MTVSINGTTGLTFNDASTQNTAASGFGFKNRIINGAMMIDQRNAGASITGNPDAFPLDRWQIEASQSSKMTTQQQTSVVPTGFTYALSVTSSSAYSVGSSDNFGCRHIIEGFNCADLGWGTANAQTATLSFWVRSSLTGTFTGAFCNGDNNYSYPFTYTISAANTWEQKTVTVVGPTAGTWGTTNGRGIQVRFNFGSGSTFSGTAGSWSAADYRAATGGVSLVGTSGATWYVTGVQLEKGSTATSFDYRPYGTELALCQRYYQQVTGGSMGVTYNTTSANWGQAFPVQMRASPTCAVSAALRVDELGVAIRTQSSSHIQTTGNGISPEAFNVFTENFSSFTAGRPVALITTGGKFTFSAEL